MNRYSFFTSIALLLCIGASCRSDDDQNIEVYLAEAKACYGLNDSSEVEISSKNLTERLQSIISQISMSNYIAHRTLSSGEILVHFRIKISDKIHNISMEVDKSGDVGCERIWIGEIVD